MFGVTTLGLMSLLVSPLVIRLYVFAYEIGMSQKSITNQKSINWMDHHNLINHLYLKNNLYSRLRNIQYLSISLSGDVFFNVFFCNIGSLVASVLQTHEAFWQKNPLQVIFAGVTHSLATPEASLDVNGLFWFW